MARCTRYKRVRSRFGGTVRRCAKFSGRAKNGRRKSRRSGMARRGSHCVRYKRVRVRGGGTQRRCAKFSGGSRRSTRTRSRYRRGKRPFNKGKKCVRKGVNKRGFVVCRSYGSTSGWRYKGRKAETRPSRLLGTGSRAPIPGGGYIPYYAR